MSKVYKVEGMTCNGCRSHVEDALQQIASVEDADVNLEKKEAKINFKHQVSLESLQEAIGEKYQISPKKEKDKESKNEQDSFLEDASNTNGSPSKIKQLQPLFLIFFYITAAAVLLNIKNFSWSSFMFDFMGLFYIVFSFFKFLDYKGFPSSFKMYDPLAKKIPVYAWLYPFIESALGLFFLFRFQIDVALISTLVILGITTIGVSQSLFNKRKIKCACLGTALNLPMTEATFIENTIMIMMALVMLS